MSLALTLKMTWNLLVEEAGKGRIIVEGGSCNAHVDGWGCCPGFSLALSIQGKQSSVTLNP